MSDNSQQRLHALDAVRGIALLLGIVFHAITTFLPGPHSWPIWQLSDSQPSIALAVVYHTLHIFRMSTFFLIAGFFAHMSFHKKDLGAFISDRTMRIAVPLVVAWPILYLAMGAVTQWAATKVVPAHPIPASPHGGTYFPVMRFPLMHLWFLYVLLILYAATLILRHVADQVDRQAGLRAVADRTMRWSVESPFGLTLLAAPIALTLFLSRHWLAWFGIVAPTNTLVPNAGTTIAYFSAFLFGWLLHRQVGLLEVWKRRWPMNLALSIALSATGLAITGVAPVYNFAPEDWRTALYAMVFTLSIWTWTFAVIGLALRFMADYSPVRRYIADSSYWLYLVHLPLAMVLQVWVAQWSWPWWVKFPFILGVAFPVLFASYQVFVRHTVIGAVLNGPKSQPAKPAVGSVQTAESAS